MSQVQIRGWIVLALLALALQGCGFRLRGSVELPAVMKQVYLQGAPAHGQLAQSLGTLLRYNGGGYVSNKDEATAVLVIEHEKQDRRILALSAAGTVSEYELNYQLRFHLEDNHGKQILVAQDISTTRGYRYDPARALAMGEEEAKLREEMAHSTAEQILRRIQARVK